MADIGHWRPAMGTHAILMASVAITFKESVNERPWRRIREVVSKAGRQAGLREMQSIQTIEMQIGPSATPAVTTGSSGAFELIKRNGSEIVEKIQVLRNGITLENHRYTRWKPMKDRVLALMQSAFEIYSESVDLSNLTASYQDGFRATSPDQDLDCSLIIDPSSPYVAGGAFNPTKQWHTHSGWFESVPDKPWIRRLQQVNIDVADAAFPEGPTRVAQITTTVSGQFNQAGLPASPAHDQTWDAALQGIQSSHERLKGMLALVLTEKARAAISLGSK